MKIVSGKSFFYSCMVLVSGIFISACGDSDTPSVVNPPLESSSSVEDIDPSIESSADATSSESTTPSSAVESSSSMESSSSATTASSSSIGSSSSAIGSVGDYCSTNFRYKYIHDKENKKFTILEDHSYDECQHLNGNYVFSHIDEVKQYNRSYIFVGDTLVLIQSKEGDPDTMTTVLVGGSANNLLGDWAFTTCDYEAGSISCNNKSKPYTIHYVFEADSQLVYTTQTDGSCIPPESLIPSDGTLDKDESYTDTYAMRYLYESIISIKKGEIQNVSIFPSSFFLQEGGITVPSEVTISSQSKYAVAFTIGGQEFSVTIGENTHRIQYYSGSQSEVDLDLTSGSAVCHLHYFSDSKLTSETCKAENAPYFQLYTHEESGIEYVEGYEIKNIDEFKACLIALAQNH
ncbi:MULTISPECIES: hypothetical protein [Fibrobacter]|uniref:hypothetical protein n=1 Tax=Fibrobacter TaxID=832 RepID=UPI001564F47F|nr:MULTISPECIES: hypothetical protein [Fibrobacter]MBR4785986.1 hypothetical protein [Fibrobacter sp.]